MTPDGQVAGVINYKAVARFTAPTDGVYDISASFKNSRNDEAAADVSVWFNGSMFDSKTISGFGFDSVLLGKTAAASAIWAGEYTGIPLSAGDTLDFVVSSAKTYHQVGFNAVITPEPFTMALLGLGGMALLRRRR